MHLGDHNLAYFCINNGTKYEIMFAWIIARKESEGGALASSK